MDLDLTSDQQALQDAFVQLANRFKDAPIGDPKYLLESSALDKALVESGFLDVAKEEGYGALEAVLLIEALGASPQSVEATGSALIGPLLKLGDLPRPVIVTRAPLGNPIRYLQAGVGTLLVDTGKDVRRVNVADITVEPAESPFNFPFGRPSGVDLDKAPVATTDVDEFRRLWRIGLSAEIVASMQPALDIVVGYVRERKQFGRPIGAFQTIQHRLAESHVLVQGSRLLTYEAAVSGSDSSAALALAYCQEAAARLIYETHQFHGAIGLTLEYPLHYWTYRLKPLMGEMGGQTEHSIAAADMLWGNGAPIADTFHGRDVDFNWSKAGPIKAA